MLNANIYQILLYLQHDNKDRQYKLERTPLEIFNQVYRICGELKKVKHPEELTTSVWNKTERLFPLHETNIIFSCVYIILYFSRKENSNIKYFLNCLKLKIDMAYFQEFKSTLNEELTFLSPLIPQITPHENTENQSQTTEKNENIISKKVRAIVISELLKIIRAGKAQNDLTKICKLIVFLTGNSFKSTYYELQQGVTFTQYHYTQIDEVNKILSDLSIPIAIDRNTQY